MINTLKLLLKSLYSDAALKGLYVKRKTDHPVSGNRQPLSLAFVIILAFLILTFLSTMSWMRKDIGTYVKSRQGLVFVPDQQQSWQISDLMQKDCLSGIDCLKYVASNTKQNSISAFSDFELKKPEHLSVTDIGIVKVNLKLNTSLWKNSFDHGNLVLALPIFSYKRVDVYLQKNHHLTNFDGSRIAIVFEPQKINTEQIDIDLLFEINLSASYFIVKPIEEKLFIATKSEYSSYIQYLITNEAGRGDWVGVIARIVMAFFVLILFLFVDGSPESLGLALFMGFEAFAHSLSYKWFPIKNDLFIRHYSLQMGDIFRLYFFLQLARMINKDVKPWLLWGSIFSIPYGILRYYARAYELNWVDYIPQWRDIIIGALGTIVCIRGAIFLWDKKLPWRVTALIIAAIASFEQIIQPVGVHFEYLKSVLWFQTFTDVMQPASAYLFALSAFINISTLENRVRSLSRAHARTKEIERDLELGRTVQQAFLRIPNLPPALKVVCHHEAAVFISGDTYFVNWDDKKQNLVFLLNDVTGHGVQAALKASACSVIAQTVARDNVSHVNFLDGRSQLVAYDIYVTEFLARMSRYPDINAMIGGEFDLKSGKLTLYRANFTFPIIIEPNSPLDERSRLGEHWHVRCKALKNRTLTSFHLRQGSFIILMSDGFLGSSRFLTNFLRYLRRSLATKDEGLNAQMIKSAILRCELFKEAAREDDRTLLVFQWVLKASENKNSADTTSEREDSEHFLNHEHDVA